ncbi:ATP-binding protein [Patescibacteria group bacterium AH-259-L05]|nr:ATP-binding protein [Patescibacteria group bacterium AH-259-L05]
MSKIKAIKNMTFYKQKNIIPVAKLEHELNIISDQIKQMNLPKGFLTFVLYVISELFANINEHSQAKKATVFLKISKQLCLINIADNGIGLRKSYLLKQIYAKDDFSAIEFALSGLSTKDFEGRGFGLHSIRKLAQELEGKMIMKTGLARAMIQKNKITFQNLNKRITGVKVDVEVPVKNINFYKIIT